MPMPVFQIVPYKKVDALIREIEDRDVAVHMNGVMPKLDEVGENSMAVMVMFSTGMWECAGYTDAVGNIRWLEGIQRFLTTTPTPEARLAEYVNHGPNNTIVAR